MFKSIFLFVLILMSSALIGMEKEGWFILKVGEKRTIGLDVVDADFVMMRGEGSIDLPINGKEKYVTAVNVSKQNVDVKISQDHGVIEMKIDCAGQPIRSMPTKTINLVDSAFLKTGCRTKVTFYFHGGL